MAELKIIAHIETDFPEKFGLPRQSGLVPSLTGTVVFEPEYRNPDAVRGLEEFSHLWLLWQFEGTERAHWSATVKPPRLGGNTHRGVFATRSPYRPNPIGLSCVKLDAITFGDRGPLLQVSGIDLRDGTPIYDIKPYLPYADSRPDAVGGFADRALNYRLTVDCPETLLSGFPAEKRAALRELLALDPRPAYHEDPARRYGVTFAGYDIHFTVAGRVLTVTDIIEKKS